MQSPLVSLLLMKHEYSLVGKRLRNNEGKNLKVREFNEIVNRVDL